MSTLTIAHGSAAEQVRLARCYLAGVAEPPAPALVTFVGEVGPVAAAARVRSGDVPGPVDALTRARRSRVRPAEDLAAAEALGARLLVPEDEDWPAPACLAFAFCGAEHLAAPLALWARGPARLAEVTERSVAVVGARAATGYGTHVAADLGFELAGRDCTVVSGAAFGIDGAAHRGALAAEGTTVAVLACGLDRAYPAAHTRLLEHIAETGLVVSEYPPGATPGRHRFLVRNRLIAGLSAGTVVVEASARSGARRTASDAALLGRPVMAVPGPITSALSVGCHRLLREPGTVPVTRAEEVLEVVGRIGDDLSDRPGSAGVRPTDVLGPTALRVHEALPWRQPREPGALSVESGLPLELVRAALPELARLGLAVPVEGGRWRRNGGARRGGA